ncbi:hypothetical protein GF377_03710 [candidate division GN15 bacterium]|nr:hypothetical protein [candidate division GN15 bacterium]
MDTDRHRDLEEVQEQIGQWREQLGSLEKMYEEAGHQLHSTYESTLDELRLSTELVAKRLTEVAEADPLERDEKMRRLATVIDQTREMFNVKLSGMKHQDL